MGDISLTKTAENGKCVIQSDKDMNLKNLGMLLGLTKNKVIQRNSSVESDSVSDINRGLYYISICCDAVDRMKNFDNEGKTSCIMTSLSIVTNQTLKGSKTHFNNIDSRVSINKGHYNALNFSVHTNTKGPNVDKIESILLYITQNYWIIHNSKINERQRICYSTRVKRHLLQSRNRLSICRQTLSKSKRKRIKR